MSDVFGIILSIVGAAALLVAIISMMNDSSDGNFSGAFLLLAAVCLLPLLLMGYR